MRLVIALSLLVVSFAAARARADACAMAVGDCQAHPLTYADENGLFDSIRFDTGFVPPSSPFQLRAALFLGAGTHVAMSGMLVAVHPPAVTLTAPGDPQGGMLEIDFGFEAILQGRIDVLGIEETFDIPIPYVPSDLRFHAIGYFDPFLLGPDAVPVEVQDSIQRFTLLTVDLFDLIFPILFADGGLRIDVQGTLVSSYWGARLELEGVGDFTVEGDSLLLPPHLPEGYGGSRELSVIKHGMLRHQGSIVLYPTLFIKIPLVGEWSSDIVDIPIPITDTTTAVEFDPSDVTLRFADVQVQPTSLDFGAVFVGQVTEKLIRIFNHGEAELRWTVSPEAGAFSPSRESGTIPPGSSVYVRILYAPGEAGLASEQLVLSTNDPDTPTLTIDLTAEAQALPKIDLDAGIEDDAGDPDVDGGDGDGGDAPRHAYAGCGCDAGARASFPLAELMLALLALGLWRRIRFTAARAFDRSARRPRAASAP
jgi:hypothetical protein